MDAPALSSESDEIVRCIFCSLDDFHQLLALRLTSKQFNKVYTAHTALINTRIAWSQFGTSLSDALQLVRLTLTRDDLPLDALITFNSEEIRELMSNASTVHALEGIYSWRYKNREFRLSHLTPEETSRFRKALYRIWLYTKRFDNLCLGGGGEEDDTVDSILETQGEFFDAFSSTDLEHLGAVLAFLHDLALWIARADDTYKVEDDNLCFSDQALFCGPAAIYEGYIDKSSLQIRKLVANLIPQGDDENGAIHELMDDYLIASLSSRVGEIPAPATLLVDNTIETTCSRCHATDRAELWNEFNWDYLAGVLQPDAIVALLRGKITKNAQSKAILMPYLAKGTRDFSNWMHQLLAVQTTKISAMTETELRCTDCLLEFIASNLHFWCNTHAKKAGAHPKDDCWYGYNCNTQVHNNSHAARMNHFCDPVK